VGKIFAENFGSEDCFKLSHGRPTNKWKNITVEFWKYVVIMWMWSV
jgi:hypothetical protein